MTWRRARFGPFLCHDRVAPASPRLDGQRFPFPGRPRPRKPGSPSATASSARETTSPPIDCPAQAVLGRIEDVVVLGDYFRVADDPMTIMQFFGEMLARHLWYSSGT